MSDEDKKRIVSQPPPPTDEVDGEWGDDDDKTLVRELPETVTKSQPAPPAAAVSGTAVAPISVPAKAAEASTPPEMKAASRVETPSASHEEEEDDEEDEDEDEDAHDDEDSSAAHHDVHDAPLVAARAPGSDWIPEWAPFAVLALLVSVSIIFGLGLVGGSGAASEEQAPNPATQATKPASKPGAHP
jgi:hypothetical protein